MKCFNCGNDIEDNLECPFCGYINNEKTKKNIRVNDSKIDYSNNEKNEEYGNDKVSNKVINVICKILCYMQVAFSIMMALVCFALEKPFFPFISWSIVALAIITDKKSSVIFIL